MPKKFVLKSDYTPQGDQPAAIDALVSGIERGDRFQTLLGVTGSGKTFTVANVIERVQRPTLVLAHNKTLAAQLCNEFREFFPGNAVEYFVSYYDYYQPEAYLPTSDTYIEKEAMINEEIDRLRHSATQALLTRRDVIVVSSVSCIYGLGAPKEYAESHLRFAKGDPASRMEIMRKLVQIQFERTTSDLVRGTFRSRGDVMEIMPPSEEVVYRLDIVRGRIDSITLIDPVTRKVREKVEEAWVFPAKHFVTPPDVRERAIIAIKKEAKEQLAVFEKEGKLLEAERLERRVNFDMAMLREVGYCHGIENYSRHLSGRAAGEPPDTLLSYFPDDFLLFVDESHVTLPQVAGMFNGDQARKKNLIQYGFRLPSAADNRPLKYQEFDKKIPQAVYVSATPGDLERRESAQIVEQIIRPTGLADPKITVSPVSEKDGHPGQIDDLIVRIDGVVARKERALVTTLTKKMAEDLTDYLHERKYKVAYLHSDIKTIERVGILTDFRKGTYDVVVGVNLLREGLDLPEVTLVAILDADKEGFLRSDTSLIQTIGRAARNLDGEVVLYADSITGSMQRAIAETDRRRKKQLAYNKEHGITPTSVKKAIKDIMAHLSTGAQVKAALELELAGEKRELEDVIIEKETEMRGASARLEFEFAALLRDEIKMLRKELEKKAKEVSKGKRRRGAPRQ
jgi:excinuclease ABC subunit B